MDIISIWYIIRFISSIANIRKLKKKGVLTDATVCLNVYASTFGRRNDVVYIEYMAGEKTVCKKIVEFGFFKSWKLGDKFKIKYDPDNVENYYILKNSLVYYIAYLIFLTFLALLVTGLILIRIIETIAG
ncbi:MAG: hypothetical protein FWF82_02375 [Oscillospiraceae bacterium]|nr:hypothetical protein [Oscillospiraceae bacterium]